MLDTLGDMQCKNADKIVSKVVVMLSILKIINANANTK